MFISTINYVLLNPNSSSKLLQADSACLNKWDIHIHQFKYVNIASKFDNLIRRRIYHRITCISHPAPNHIDQVRAWASSDQMGEVAICFW